MGLASPYGADRRQSAKRRTFEHAAIDRESAAVARTIPRALSRVPVHAILYYDKAYLLAPDKRGNRPYSLLHEAMRTSGRCALAKWAWRLSN